MPGSRRPEALRGTVGATQRLARALGLRLAKDMMFTGRRLSAEEALRLGFVTRLVSPAALERELAAIARAVCEAPPQAMRLAKRCLDAGEAVARAAALARELEAIEEQLAAGGELDKR
ncbi:MAG: enoyl-CoA hydratase/isomerase family protein [Burkholderiales bacterium]|nr:enoyl-CoA hydratase/isomerase family protein [Burkholderiales bacterium]